MKDAETSIHDETEQNSAQQETFLRRWSKRKLAASTELAEPTGVEQASPLTSDDQQLESNTVEPQKEQPQRELTDEDMPPLETLDEHSDYTGFFSPRVSGAW